MSIDKTCDTEHSDDEVCELCCEHYDKENGHCIDCGKDCTEDMMSDAFDRYKDSYKYGE